MDETREFMRYDLDLRPSEPGDARRFEAGITRRGFPVGAGLADTVAVTGGIAWSEYATKVAPAEAELIGRSLR